MHCLWFSINFSISFPKNLFIFTCNNEITAIHLNLRLREKYHLPSSKQVLWSKNDFGSPKKPIRQFFIMILRFQLLFSFREHFVFLNFINWQKEITISNQKIINHCANLGELMMKKNQFREKDFITLVKRFRIGN